MVCSAHLFVLPIDVQASFELVEAAGRNGANFFQCSTAWVAFQGLGVQDVSEFNSS
jgi:hypothetical protein